MSDIERLFSWRYLTVIWHRLSTTPSNNHSMTAPWESSLHVNCKVDFLVLNKKSRPSLIFYTTGEPFNLMLSFDQNCDKNRVLMLDVSAHEHVSTLLFCISQRGFRPSPNHQWLHVKNFNILMRFVNLPFI